MNKMQMAHEYALKQMESLSENSTMKSLVSVAWQYADAMQAEAEKRNKAEAEQKRKEVREMLNADNTFLEKEGQHFDDVADVRKTYSSSEWQPDWSQAPSGALSYHIELDELDGSIQPFWTDSLETYFDGEMFVGYKCAWNAPSFNYQGNWQDSLRKRLEPTKNIDPKEYIDAVLQYIVDLCDHEWTHISKFGAEGDFYVCPCGAKSKRPQRRTK